MSARALSHAPDTTFENLEPIRADVWLWRARFFKTRSAAARFIELGHVRRHRNGQLRVRLDKASRLIGPGDLLTFVVRGRLITAQILNCGHRRGQPSEARALYRAIEDEISV